VAKRRARTTATDTSDRARFVGTSKAPVIADRGLVLTIYILYFVGYFIGITTFIGAMIAYLQAPSAESTMKSHYIFQIRTFWIGLLYVIGGVLLLYQIIGGFILLWGFVWSVIRNIKGVLALNRYAPITNPKSWLFGD
jgi:uncharacterized membrane protein